MAVNMMQAARVHEYGGPEALALEKTPVPQPQAGQVLVHLFAAGVNPADWKMQMGMYKAMGELPMPWTPGLEGAGTIETPGSGVGQFKPGQAVYGVFNGGYAEYAVAKEGDLVPKPAKLTFEEAASVPVGALTAWGTIEAAGVHAGQQVLVHGAAGGVGAYVVQLARWKGAHVTGTASAANVDFVKSLGAERAIDYNAAPFESVVKEMDVVIDTVGGDLPERSLGVLRPGGVLVTVAARLSPEMGQARGVRTVTAGRAPTSRLVEINQLLEAGTLRPVVGKVFPLSQARQAQELSRTGHGRGRIVLKIRE